MKKILVFLAEAILLVCSCRKDQASVNSEEIKLAGASYTGCYDPSLKIALVPNEG